MTQAGRGRLVYYDVIRCIAITAIFLTHCISGNILVNAALYGTRSWYAAVVLNVFCCAGVGLFFMLTGALLLPSPETADIGRFYKKRFKRILIPLLVWSAVYFAADVIVKGEPADILLFLSRLINEGYEYHMWFIYTLAGIYLLAPFLKRIVDSCTIPQLALLFVISIFPTTIRPFLNTVTPAYIFLFDPLLNGYIGFFLLGYILSRAELTRGWRILVYAGGIAGAAISIIGNIAASSADGIDLIFNGGYSITRYLTAAAIFLAARSVFKNRSSIPGLIGRAVAGLSAISFDVYWVHVLFIDAAEKLLRTDVSPIISAIVVFIAAYIGSVIAAAVIGAGRRRLKVLVRKK